MIGAHLKIASKRAKNSPFLFWLLISAMILALFIKAVAIIELIWWRLSVTH